MSGDSYNPERSSRSGASTGFQTISTKRRTTIRGRSITVWICFRIHRVRDCTSDIGAVTFCRIAGRDTSGSRVSTSFIRWDGTHSVHRPKTTPSRKESSRRVSTKRNIENFKRQLHEIGAMYDWSREVNTTDPDYYKWTQWIFVKMFKAGLAYKTFMPVNWCPSCKTGIANEDVVNGRCERCGTEVTKKELNQWMLRITKYADRLLSGLEKLDWPEKVKTMQSNWIGRSEGAEVTFTAIAAERDATSLEDFHDAAGHALRRDLHGHGARASIGQRTHVSELRPPRSMPMSRRSKAERDIDRAAKTEKTGVFTGAYAINPVNDEKIPIWIADYVLMAYGTGAIMAVPAHDERDYEFAKKFGLEIREVVSSEPGHLRTRHSSAKATMVNSGQFTGRASAEGRKAIVKWLEEKGLGHGHRQLQAARLGFFAATLLGRADPDRSLFDQLRSRSGPRRGPAGPACRTSNAISRRAPANPRWRLFTIGSIRAARIAAVRRNARPTRCRNGPARRGTSCAIRRRTPEMR